MESQLYSTDSAERREKLAGDAREIIVALPVHPYEIVLEE